MQMLIRKMVLGWIRRTALGTKGVPVEQGYEDNSGTNPHFLSVEELKEITKMVEL
jgi:UDP-N-acetylglucosamine 4,6-dehydratase/5-epimerase